MSPDPAPAPTSSPELIRTLRDRVFERKPFLKNIIDKLGDKSLLEYVRGYADVEIHPLMKSRQEEFLTTFENEVAETLSSDAAKRARAQLKKTFFASTNDHHGPLNSIDFYSAHVLLALSAMNPTEPVDMDAIIVLSCCNVSLNNISFPRGLLFSVKTPAGIVQRRLSLLPSNAHACCLYGFRAYEQREIEKLRKLLRQHVREGMIPASTADKLDHIVTDIFGDPATLHRRMYSAQSSVINTKLWDLVFRGQKKAPIMVNVGQERLVSRLLQDHHLRQDTLIHRLLFRPEYERMTMKHFDGIYGAFSAADKSGTYLFWGRSPVNGMRLRMQRSGESLVSDDGSVSVPWTSEGIAQGLRDRILIPSILLVFQVLSFYYGLKCLGGYSQVNYLTFMKEAFIAMMRELGETEAAEACEPVSTKNWSGLTFAYIDGGGVGATQAQFLDLHLHADAGMWDRLMDYSRHCTLRQAIDPLLPEIYRYSYTESERDGALMALTSEAFAAAADLKPCLHIA